MAVEASSGDSAVLVFVYGSLRRGEANHPQMAGCRWVGEAELSGLDLYDLGPFPMAVPADDAGSRLQGELYAVDAEQLARLDRFEGVPRLYERQRHRLSDGRAVWVYVGRLRQVRHVQRLPSGRWRGTPSRPEPLLAALLTALLPALLSGVLPGLSNAARASDLRHDCLLWQRAPAAERTAVADRIGSQHLLTRTHQPGDPGPEHGAGQYSWSDIQRLCRRQ
jgi:gamma-glutamylcyclotransferase (GGCT)/AIG2-like uncharacterized protein YtfP